MDLIVALIIGILFASGTFLLLHRNVFQIILGVVVFSYATIYFLFIISGVTENSPPLLKGAETEDLTLLADPLPQALTLTAIVIGIGIQLFVIVLLKNVYNSMGTEDMDDLNFTDKLD